MLAEVPLADLLSHKRFATITTPSLTMACGLKIHVRAKSYTSQKYAAMIDDHITHPTVLRHKVFCCQLEHFYLLLNET